MKKFVSTVMSLALVATLSVTAFAAPGYGTLTEKSPSGHTTAWYNAGSPTGPQGDDPTTTPMEGTYVVTIPEFIETVKMATTTKPETVSATQVLLLPKTKLDIKCDYSGDLTLKQESKTKLKYKMQNNTKDFTTGSVVLTCAAGTPSKTFNTSIGAILTAAPLFAGNYSDTITFTCTVNPIA